ncbi:MULTISPECIES: ABC transporter ATP-binding protein [Halolamina]|uniref:Peptide/nickel transport system ATP-binding protein/oligopeptide transport system ATP-binding protein n=1 Tax=Halolamina pelagica TaxID=699431 RepID=A0A1I5W9E8_9EURY|nr:MULTISPECIES: ABC transporter ATP-binding protein [Halolamina]NHX37502.1 ABC transporter ATP-binding protein [Halolamina sp. R1-12]SFQ16370.1 peptide/nickel transport system ATP-binding protein/oligopeptide transport system ATP-binding protein [Halolamina pelagica]
MSLVEAQGLRKYFSTGSGFVARYFSDERVHAVDGVDLEIERGQTMGLVGESGCGKSTLGNLLMRIHEPTEGTVSFGGTDITALSGSELRPYRSEMQMVFQNPQNSLNPKHSVGKILRKAIEFHDVAQGDEADALARQYLSDVGLRPEHVERYPHEFSGGQQQRIAIARALSVDPEFIVLDEPVSALDVSVQAKILDLIEELKVEYDLTLLFITHDLNVVRHVCDEVSVMYLGEIVENAPTPELFEDPYHPYTRALFDSITLPEPGELEAGGGIKGETPSPIDPPSGCRFRTRCPEAMEECETVNPELVERERDTTAGTRRTACHLYDAVDD